MLRAFLLVALATVASAQEYLERIERLPVAFNGRETTFADWAEGVAARISGGRDITRENGERVAPTRWVLDMMSRHRDGDRARAFHVPAEIVEAFGLELEVGPDGAALAPVREIRDLGARAWDVSEERGSMTPSERSILERFALVHGLADGYPRPRIRTERGLRGYVSELESLRSQVALPLVLPPREEGQPWDAFLDRMRAACTADEPADDPLLEVYVRLLDGHRRSRGEVVRAALDELERAFAALDPVPRRALRYVLPEGWSELGVPPGELPDFFEDIRGCARRVASFRTPGGLSTGLVHVVGPTRSTGSYWQEMRRGRHLAPGTEDSELHLRELPVAGAPSLVFDALSCPRTGDGSRGLAAILRRGPHSFVYTAWGPQPEMDAQMPGIEAFLASLEIGTPAALEEWTGRRSEAPDCAPPGPARVAVAALPLAESTAVVMMIVPPEAEETSGDAIRKFLRHGAALQRGEESDYSLPPEFFLETDRYEPMTKEQRAELVVLVTMGWAPPPETYETVRARLEWLEILGEEFALIALDPPH